MATVLREPRPTVLPAMGERSWAWPLGVALLVLSSLVLWLPSRDAAFDPDVASYATVAYWWARGDTLYEQIMVPLPPGIFAIFRLIETGGLGSLQGIHMVAAVYATLCTLALLAVVARVWGRTIGFGAAACFALVVASPYLQGYTANTELFMTLPLLGRVYLLLCAGDYSLGRGIGWWLTAGAGWCAALATLIKQAGIAGLALVVVWLWWRGRMEEGSGWWRGVVAAGLGFLVGLLPAAVHALLTVPWLYLDAVLLYRLTKHSAAAHSPGDQFSNFINTTGYIISHLPVLLIAVLGCRAQHQATCDERGAGGSEFAPRQQEAFLWFWLLTAFAGMALGGNWYAHYYLQILPPLAIAVALGVRAMLSPPQGWGAIVLRGLVGASLLWFGLTLGSMLALLALPNGPSNPATRYLPDRTVAVKFAPHSENQRVATYLRDHTTPDERIAIVYQKPGIYYFAQRRPSGRVPLVQELMYTSGGFDDFLARLNAPATAPRYIVTPQPFNLHGLDPHGVLQTLVARDYVLETTIDAIPVYRRADPARAHE